MTTVNMDVPGICEELVRQGICLDCGNDKCMADGRTGLWCPACDASYLLLAGDAAVRSGYVVVDGCTYSGNEATDAD